MCKVLQEFVANLQKHGTQNLLIFTTRLPQAYFFIFLWVTTLKWNVAYLPKSVWQIDLWSWLLVLYIKGVSSGLHEHSRACKQCIYFCEQEQWSNLSCEQWALENTRWWAVRLSEIFHQPENIFFKRKRCFATSNLADTSKTKKMCKAHHGSTNPSSLQPIVPCLMLFNAKLCHVYFYVA